MPLINCKVDCSLAWIENCVLATSVNIANDAVANVVKATFKIKDAKLCVPVVTLSKEDNIKLRKQSSEGFKRSVYWNKYKVIPDKNEVGTNDNPKYIRELLDSRSYKVVCSCL